MLHNVAFFNFYCYNNLKEVIKIKKYNKKKIFIYSFLTFLFLGSFFIYFYLKLRYYKISIFIKINSSYFLLSFIFILLAFSLFSLSDFLLTIINKFTISKRISFYLNYSHGFLKGITPSKRLLTPLMPHYYRKHGIKKNKNAKTVLTNYLMTLSVNTFVCGGIILFFLTKITKTLKGLSALVFIICLLEIIFVILLFLFIYSNKFYNFITKILLIIKQIKPLKRKAVNALNEISYLRDSLKIAIGDIFNNYFKFFILKIIKLISYLTFYITPYFIMRGIGITSGNFIDVFLVAFLSHIISEYIPLPGGAIIFCYLFYSFSHKFFQINNTALLISIFSIRFITYYLYLFYGLFFYFLLLIRERKLRNYQLIRNNKILTKEYKKIPYDILYLSDNFDTKKFMELYKIFKILNIRVKILAQNIINDLKLPKSDVYTLEKLDKKGLKKTLKNLQDNPPEIFLTNTNEYFAKYARKLAHNIKAPLIFIEENKLEKNNKKILLASNIIISFLNNLNNKIYLDDIKSLNHQELNALFLEKVNIYNINKLNNLNYLNVLILGGDTKLGKIIASQLEERVEDILLYQEKRIRTNLKVRQKTGDYSYNSIYYLLKNNDFNIVIDCLDKSYATQWYNILFNLLIDFNINYYLSYDYHNNLRPKESQYPKDDPIITTAKEKNLLNILTLKIPEIITKETNLFYDTTLLDDNKKYNIILDLDIIKITEIGLRNLIKFKKNDKLKLDNYYKKEDIIKTIRELDSDNLFSLKENKNNTLKDYKIIYTLSDMILLENSKNNS